MTDILSSIRSAHKVALLALFVTLCGVPTWAYGDVAIEDGLDAPVILFGASGYQMEKDEAPSYDILPTDLNAAGTDSELVFDDDSENGGKGVGDASPGQLSGDSAGTSDGSANLEKAVDVTVPGEVDKAARGETHAPEKELEELEEELSATSEQIVADGWTVDGSGAVLYYEGGSALTGWLVDDGYRSYGLQRYWFDSAGRLVVGSLADVGGGEWAYARPEGFVVRGKYVAADGSVYLADNDGRLERAGWVVTDSYDGGMQRYWVDASTHAAATGFFEAEGSSYYGLPGDGRELRGAAAVGGELVLADNDGRLLERGWAVTDAFGQGLQRYWFEGFRAARSLLADVGGGEWAYARPEGFVVRGKYVAADGSVYLADNDGRLERAGWVVTDSYDGGMQRYWVDASTHAAATGFFEVDGASYYGNAATGFVVRGRNVCDGGVLLSDNDGRLASGEGWLVSRAYSDGLERYWLYKMSNGYVAARVGFFTASDGKAYYAYPSSGTVARGKTSYGSGVLLSDNEGVLVENIAGEGWLVTGLYDDGMLQRYRIDKSCGGHLGAHVGMFSLEGDFYYGLPSVGYVLRNATSMVDGRWCNADNDGTLTFIANRAFRLSDGTYQWTDSSGRVNQNEAMSRLMSAAHSVLGVPYVWLGNYPEDGGMDCASFTYWCYKQIGITIDFETYGQIHEGRAVSLSEARPGDLILMYFSSPGVPEHVVMYAGNGMVYEEPTFGGHCQYVPLSSKNAWDIVVRRILA